MTARARIACLAALLAATLAGCGQTGPLALPENARPIERVDQPAEPERQQTDDERQDER
ncbi:MAG TPA: lipoprotein [Gammaproteobacteria bacterium]|nr:lipoprotein [Gammaproteobacteria bacterium]